VKLQLHKKLASQETGNEEKIDAIYDEWSGMVKSSCEVDSQLYTKYDVKRGLRDISGKGVMAGLTRIGEVVATASDDDEKKEPHGELIYRGIDITQLVDGFIKDGRHGFEETSFLLLFGELPREEQLSFFLQRMAAYRELPRRFVHDAILKMPSRDIMNSLARSVLAMYSYDEQPDDISIKNVLRQSLQLIAAFPTISVYAYHAYVHNFKRKSLVIHRPDPKLSTAENILHMLRPDSKYTELEARLLDLALVLHAEHGGGNNSSFTAHVVSSSGTDTYSAIAASLGSLKGPRHGGANIKVVHMLDELKTEVGDWSDDEEIGRYLTRLLNKDAFDHSGLIYGMGHPVYSVSDPRTLILRRYAEKLAEEKGLTEEFKLYSRIEKLAPEVIGSARKIYKGVCANVDFYSGFVYKMLGIPTELFTPLFAIARNVGWCAHRIEEIANEGKIIRPAYKSVAARQTYVSIGDRTS
jgi:citrate synthase